jgi:hypothetical protein
MESNGKDKGMTRVVRPFPILTTQHGGYLKHSRGHLFDPPVRVEYEGMYIVWEGRGSFTPQEGWYDAPSLYRVVWVNAVILLAESAPGEDGVMCRVYRVEEGLPPREAVVPRRPHHGFKWRET